MHKIVVHCLLAGILTLVNLAIFIHWVPVPYEAWGTTRPFMVTISILILVSAESLANLWRAAVRSPEASAPAAAPGGRSVLDV